MNLQHVAIKLIISPSCVVCCTYVNQHLLQQKKLRKSTTDMSIPPYKFMINTKSKQNMDHKLNIILLLSKPSLLYYDLMNMKTSY